MTTIIRGSCRAKNSIYARVILSGVVIALSLQEWTSPFAQADTARVAQKATDLAGVAHSIPGRGPKATVLVFIAHDCPISNAYAPEISRIASDYARRGVQFFVVYAENGFSAKRAREHARQYDYRVPAFLDAAHRLSAATGATVTPEVAVIAPNGRRLYLGRIDNRYVGYGKKRAQATQSDLRLALDATLAGKPVLNSTTEAIGCFIPTDTK